MKKIVATLLALVSLLVSGATYARETVPIINIENIAIATSNGKTPSLAELKAAIMRAGLLQQWNMSDAGPGKLTGTLFVRGKHSIAVDITYSTNQFSVIYVNSVNMKYEVKDGVPSIHPSYSKWVQTLVNNIRIETQRL